MQKANPHAMENEEHTYILLTPNISSIYMHRVTRTQILLQEIYLSKFCCAHKARMVSSLLEGLNLKKAFSHWGPEISISEL
jgi:hypothetical protein